MLLALIFAALSTFGGIERLESAVDRLRGLFGLSSFIVVTDTTRYHRGARTFYSFFKHQENPYK